MKLESFLRGIVCHIFQPMVTSNNESVMFGGSKMSYENTYFYLNRIRCRDGFNISIQINNGNYCGSEKGYRKMGYVWERVEFGFSNVNEPHIAEISGIEDTSEDVGSIGVDQLQAILDTYHGGIDWDETLSLENCTHLMRESITKSVKKIR